MKIVIDTNRFIAALIKKEELAREIIINSGYDFIFPEYEFQEVYKYKEDILRKAGYSEIEFIQAISSLLNHMKIVSNEEIQEYYTQARKLIGEIDSDDMIFIATALAFDAMVWSDDLHFKMQNEVKALNTEELVNLLK
jgi:predicted nucleic acid-binding protein